MQKYELYLDDILEAIEKIEHYTEGMRHEDFISNQLVMDAVIRNLEVIGEAAKHIPAEAKRKYSQDWKKISSLRDILIHAYFGVNAAIIWDIIANKLSLLKETITRMRNDIRIEK